MAVREDLRAVSETEQYIGPGRWDRHRHGAAYAAMVLEGGYLEAGDSGRWQVEPGDVVLHRAFEAHANTIGRARCVVLNLPLPPASLMLGVVRPRDPDLLASAIRADSRAAIDLLGDGDLLPPLCEDWPDLLACDLRRGPVMLGAWAKVHALSQSTLTRGFAAAYGTGPARYRLAQQALRAFGAIVGTRDPLAEIADDCGFADQAHMSRAVRHLTGASPYAIRGGKTVQDGESRSA